MNQPPPLPVVRSPLPRRIKALVTLAVLPAVCVVLLLVLRLLGLLCPFNVPTGAMAPAVRPGDNILMEDISYLHREIRRGDIIVFRTENIPGILGPPAIFLKRVAGLPGERLQIKDGKLYVNDQPVTLKNEAGEIHYANMGRFAQPAYTVTVPDGHYFVLGDTSTNSADSRYWGFVSRRDVMGRAFFCYLPLSRAGAVK